MSLLCCQRERSDDKFVIVVIIDFLKQTELIFLYCKDVLLSLYAVQKLKLYLFVFSDNTCYFSCVKRIIFIIHL